MTAYLWHSPGTPQHRSFPQLNFHRGRVHRNRKRPRANGFTGCAQLSGPFNPHAHRASGKALAFTGTYYAQLTRDDLSRLQPKQLTRCEVSEKLGLAASTVYYTLYR